MKLILSLLFLFTVLTSIAQTPDEYWTKWNTNYPETNIHKVLQFKNHYADSVEKDKNIAQYYARLDKYRFSAQYTGKIRSLNRDVLKSMMSVFALFVDKSVQLENLCKSEVLFKVDNKEIWMPIQEEILKALREEASAKDNVLLYCLFLNQHTSNKELYNTFF